MDDEHLIAPRPGLVLPVRVDPAGVFGPTRKQARGPRWRRVCQGRYVPSTAPLTVEQRIVEVSAVVPPTGAVTGWAALRWQGGRWFDGTTVAGEAKPVTVVIGTHDIRAQPGIAISAESATPCQIHIVDDVRVMRPVAALSFEMRYARSDPAAAQLLDLAAYSDLVSIEELVAFVTPGQNAWTGVPRARRAANLADENCWSPREFWMRQRWTTDTGLPVPLTNRPVFDLQGRHLGTPDLIDPDAGVFGEYDGDHHLDRAQRTRDISREALFRDHGLEGVVMIAGEPDGPFLKRLRGAYARARARTTPSRWTLEPPSSWVPTHTVALRRALSDDQRRRFLGYRSA